MQRLAPSPRGADRVTGFDALYRAHAPAVAVRLRALGVQDAAIEDALQDVFVVAFRRAHTFQGRATIREWLLGIARRIASRYRRGHARTTRRHDALSTFVHAQAQAQADTAAEAERRCDLAQMFASLDPDCRSILLLGVEGHTREELGHALGVRPTTAYSRLVAARRAATSWLRRGGSDDARSEPRSSAAWLGIALPWRVLWVPLVAIGVIGGAVAYRGPRDLVTLPVAEVHPERAPATAAVSLEARGDPPPTTAIVDDASENLEEAEASATVARPRGAAPPPVERAVADIEEPTPTVMPPVRPPEAAPPASSLRIELDLLLRARGAVNDGRHEHARALLDEHARRFPESTLARERERTRDALARAASSAEVEAETNTDR